MGYLVYRKGTWPVERSHFRNPQRFMQDINGIPGLQEEHWACRKIPLQKSSKVYAGYQRDTWFTGRALGL